MFFAPISYSILLRNPIGGLPFLALAELTRVTNPAKTDTEGRSDCSGQRHQRLSEGDEVVGVVCY